MNKRRRYFSPSVRICSVDTALMLMGSKVPSYDGYVPGGSDGDMDINVNPGGDSGSDGDGWDAGDAF